MSRASNFNYNKECAHGSAAAMADYARKQADAGNIAPVSAMSKRPVWVMASDADTVVHPGVGVNAASFYETFSDAVVLYVLSLSLSRSLLHLPVSVGLQSIVCVVLWHAR